MGFSSAWLEDTPLRMRLWGSLANKFLVSATAAVRCSQTRGFAREHSIVRVTVHLAGEPAAAVNAFGAVACIAPPHAADQLG